MNLASSNMKIGFISTSNYALNFFLKEYIDALAKTNDVTLISNLDHGIPETRKNVNFQEVPFRRRPHPLSDSINLIRLSRIIHKNKFDVIYTISPKGGFIGMLAATFMRVDKRIHFFTGQVWVTRKGFWKFLLKSMDHIIGSMSTFSLIDSPSQRQFLLQNSIITESKSTVLGSGSISGVDTKRFTPSVKARHEIRKKLGIPEDMVILVFLGRLNKDKGVMDLALAFKELSKRQPNTGLLFVGSDEGMLEPMQKEIQKAGLENKVWFQGLTPIPEKFLAAGDIFCMPSYREGFGLVIIEAASTGLPAVGSDIYGVCDAIQDGETGILHEAGNINAIAQSLETLVQNPSLRKKMSAEALKRARSEFSRKTLLEKFENFHAKQVRF